MLTFNIIKKTLNFFSFVLEHVHPQEKWPQSRLRRRLSNWILYPIFFRFFWRGCSEEFNIAINIIWFQEKVNFHYGKLALPLTQNYIHWCHQSFARSSWDVGKQVTLINQWAQPKNFFLFQFKKNSDLIVLIAVKSRKTKE